MPRTARYARNVRGRAKDEPNMQLRIARHTERLDELVAFYRDGLGLTEIGGFREARAPLAGVKAGAGKGDEEEVDLITGATISSRTVVDIITNR